MSIYSGEFARWYTLELYIGDGGKPGRENVLTGGRVSFGNSDEKDLMSSAHNMGSALSKHSKVK